MTNRRTTGKIKSSPFKKQDLGERGSNKDACIELRLRKAALTPDYTSLPTLVSIAYLPHAFLISGPQSPTPASPTQVPTSLLSTSQQSRAEASSMRVARRWTLCPSPCPGKEGSLLPAPSSAISPQ